jgi:CDP-2,3-bis-(O-geranylgeranyl)-sn-glycerol synthase
VAILEAARALLLVAIASSAPWAIGRALGRRWAAPVDLGRVLRDGRRLFGAHKTWRGVAAGVGACALVAPLCGLDAAVGAGVGAAALAGDLASSFVKRRLDRRPGTEVPGLDQVPESLLPLALFAGPLGLGPAEIALVVAVFVAGDMLAAPLRR